MPSSVGMTGAPGGQFPGMPAGGAVPAPTVPRPAATKKPAVVKAAKPTLTGFVITCRLKPNAKLIPPSAMDTAQNGAAPARTSLAAPAADSHGESDNSDDTVDIE